MWVLPFVQLLIAIHIHFKFKQWHALENRGSKLILKLELSVLI
jgi:hypothetical protein